MAAVGSISIGVSAKTDKFTKGMGKAGKSASKFSKGLKVAALGAAAFGVAVAAAGIAVGVKMVKDQLEAIDSLAKLSDILGLSTEKLVAYQHSGELAGVSSAQMDKGLKTLSRTLGEANLGMSSGVTILKDMGFAADEFKGMKLSDAVEKIAAKMNGMSSESDKAAFAIKAFGKPGQAMVNWLAIGAKGFAEAERETRLFGMALTEVEADKIEEANDAMTRLGGLVVGIARQLTIYVAPAITKVANSITGFAIESEIIPKLKRLLDMFVPFIKTLAAFSAQFATMGLGGGMLKFLTGLEDMFAFLHKGFLAVEATILGIPSSWKTAIGSIMATTGEFFAGQGGFISKKVSAAVGFVGGKDAAEGMRDTGLAMMTTGLEEEQAVWKKFNNKKAAMDKKLWQRTMRDMGIHVPGAAMGEAAAAGAGGSVWKTEEGVLGKGPKMDPARRVMNATDFNKYLQQRDKVRKAGGAIPGTKEILPINVNDTKAQKLLTSIRDEVAGGFVAVTA